MGWWKDGEKDGREEGYVDGWMEGQVDGWVGDWMGKRKKERVECVMGDCPLHGRHPVTQGERTD